ncbi:MAG: hypothetical protein JEY99_16110 [Spirochaetales bacterium]|nr:hypothetical protein [Spirochaetales bacterium]
MRKIHVIIRTAVILTLFFSSCGSGNIYKPLPKDFPADSTVKEIEWQNLEGDFKGQLLRIGPNFPPVRFLVISGESEGRISPGFYNQVLIQELFENLKVIVAKVSPDFLIQIGSFPESVQLQCPVYSFSSKSVESIEPLKGILFLFKPYIPYPVDSASFLILPDFSGEVLAENLQPEVIFPVIFTSGDRQEISGYKGAMGEWQYIVSTPPITAFPYSWRMITIDDRQIMNIQGDRIIPDFESGPGDDSFQSSLDGRYLGLRDEIIPSLMESYSITRRRAGIMAEYQAALELLRIAGEEAGPLPESIYKRALKSWMKKAPEDFDQMIRILGTDQLPPDNLIQIDLVSGRWRSIPD